MITLIIVLLVFIPLIFAAALMRRGPMYYYDDEDEYEEVVTTTTTIQGSLETVGRLRVELDGVTNQPYVIDPADAQKIYVNSSDDMYEDAAGDIWELR